MGSVEVLRRLESMIDGKLTISNLGLTELPESELWKDVIHLHCTFNGISVLPDLPNVKTLICYYNWFTKLPELPNVENLNCEMNTIIMLPELPNVKYLNCGSNQLTEIPELPKIEQIFGKYNQLKFQPEHYKYIHQIRKVTIALAVIKQWRKYNQESVRNKKQDLHIELLYSPDLPFYLQQPEVQHWFDQMN